MKVVWLSDGRMVQAKAGDGRMVQVMAVLSRQRQDGARVRARALLSCDKGVFIV